MDDDSPILLGCAEMAAVDRAAEASGVSIDRLMSAAGHAVADVAASMAPLGRRVAVLCGPGANGGDGYVAARVLAARGYAVTAYTFGDPPTDSAAFRAKEAWSGSAEPLASFDGRAELIIDALFGAGLSRPLDGAAAAAIAIANASGKPIIAVDLPSGLDGDTGLPLGPVVEATRTVTFFRLKPGHLLWPGRSLCGRVQLAQIGLTEAHLALLAPATFRNGPALWRATLPMPSPRAHKYQRGSVLVASGPELATGAARLSAMAALNAGAGAVTLAGGRDALRIHAAHVTAVMLREAEIAGDFARLLASGRYTACVIGPATGVNADTATRIEALRQAGLPTVFDADAITSLAKAEKPFPLPPGAVLTPHEGEFERLFGPWLAADPVHAALPARLAMSRLEKARAAARLSGAVVVLKGIDTVIAGPDGRGAINDNAGPELATAGSGDVLAGLIAAHLAHGMAPFEAAASAVWLHGACGAAYGLGLTAERLVDMVRPLRAFLPEEN